MSCDEAVLEHCLGFQDRRARVESGAGRVMKVPGGHSCRSARAVSDLFGTGFFLSRRAQVEKVACQEQDARDDAEHASDEVIVMLIGLRVFVMLSMVLMLSMVPMPIYGCVMPSMVLMLSMVMAWLMLSVGVIMVMMLSAHLERTGQDKA